MRFVATERAVERNGIAYLFAAKAYQRLLCCIKRTLRI